MGWRLASLALAWVAGVAAQLQQPGLWEWSDYAGLFAAGILGLLLAIRWPRAFAAGLLGAALLGFGSAGWRASLRLADALPPALEDREIQVTGVIAGLPQRSAAGIRFPFEVDSATLRDEPLQVPSMIAMGWYKGMHEDAALSQPQSELGAGQRWRFTVKLRRPHGSMNPYGFDYELLLFEQGVRATGYVRDAPAPELLERAAGYPVDRLRQRVRDAIDASVSDRRAAGVLAALAVGDQGSIEREDWDIYRNVGIAHLVSISGLHITMFAWLAGLLIAWLWRRSRRAMSWIATPLAARWGGLASAAAYAVFSGWGVPSRRTILMLSVVTLFRTVGIRWPWPTVMLLAAVIVTAVDPWALMQAGFWLSFFAVALLMASSSDEASKAAAAPHPIGWLGWPHRVWDAIRGNARTQVIATIGLTPLSVVFFQQVSIVGLLGNFIAIPVVTLVITPLSLLGVAVVPLWSVGAWCVQRLNVALGWLAHLPGAVWLAPVAPFWAQVAGLLGALVMCLPLPWRARALALPLLVPLLWPQPDVPAEGAFDLIALDIGQGSSIIVRTRTHELVFDAGPKYSTESDAGQRVVLPLLRARGEARLDKLVLSHRDLDHVGGAGAMLKAMPIDDLLSSLEAGHPLLDQATHTTRCSAGQSWLWDGVRFDMLRPLATDYDRVQKTNAMSCVLHVSAGGRSALLVGDIEKEQEAALIARSADALRSDVLVVPHHGSRTSSTGAFIDAVAPRIAVFQAGYRNRFGHPAADVMDRYRTRGVQTRVTPDCGAFVWRADGPRDGVCQRDDARRYWHFTEARSAAPSAGP